MARRKRRVRGEGALRKRADGRWEGSLIVGYDSGGKPRRRSVYGATKGEAAAKLLELRYRHDQQEIDSEPALTVRELAELWLDSRGNVLPDTLYKYRRELDPLLKTLGHIRVDDLRAHHVRDAYSRLSRGRTSVRSQRRSAMHFRSVLRQAVQDERIHRSVAEGVRVSAPRVSPVATVWTPSEVKAFLATARQDPLYVYFYLLITLGIRSGEALGLPWRAIDFGGGKLTIYQALRRVDRGSRLELSEVKTANSRRTLALPADVVRQLEAHREAAGPDVQGSALVIATGSGQPIDPSNTRRSLRRLASAAKVPSVRVHDLRHTHASLALAAGVPVEVVSRRLGHASIGITLDLYRHLYQPELDAAALSLDRLLAGMAANGLRDGEA